MIQGTVTDIGVPIITIPIAGKEWPATIDTGFNGDLELPEALRNVLKPQYVGRVTSGLAGGQTVDSVRGRRKKLENSLSKKRTHPMKKPNCRPKELLAKVPEPKAKVPEPGFSGEVDTELPVGKEVW
jgi:hypothetical protein